MHTFSIRSALACAFKIPLQSTARNCPSMLQRASFSTSGTKMAKKKKTAKPDHRITMVRYHLHHPTTLMPRPLRFSRNRYLRHWTIHRAWQLFKAKEKTNRQLELERQYNAMAAACEELRVGAGDGGRLFRKSMMKTGTWGLPEKGGGVPIDYASGMMEWVGGPGVGVGEAGGKPRIWDHEWKRA